MNNMDRYKNEMNKLHHNIESDVIILDKVYDGDNNANKKHWKIAASSAIIILACVATFVLSPTLASYAKNFLKSFGLTIGDNRKEMSECVAVDFDYGRFVSSEGVIKNGVEDAYIVCEDVDALRNVSGVELPQNDEIMFRNILLHVSEKYNNAHMSMEVVRIGYEKIATMNAQFIINSVENYDGLAYGYDEGNVIQEYVCSDGSTAFFIQHSDYEKQMIVIFVVKGIQYQLFVDNTDEGYEFAKQVIAVMIP